MYSLRTKSAILYHCNENPISVIQHQHYVLLLDLSKWFLLLMLFELSTKLFKKFNYGAVVNPHRVQLKNYLMSVRNHKIKFTSLLTKF